MCVLGALAIRIPPCGRHPSPLRCGTPGNGQQNHGDGVEDQDEPEGVVVVAAEIIEERGDERSTGVTYHLERYRCSPNAS